MEFSQNAFAAPSRTLTGLGTITLQLPSAGHTALANGATADLRPASGLFRDIVVVGEALANVTWVPGLFDGTTFRAGPASASGSAMIQVLKGSNAFGPAIQNTGTVPGNYNMAGGDLSQ